MLGATGKSAQIPLYVWLPDAMEGPTPVSALIHAATMVTAGIYMVARCHTLFDRSPYALGVVAIIGAATAIFAACIGMVQHDIKRVLAYSTVSQLGYMFLACGVGAYAAGIFHLLTHAFFKALLFLAAGSVIHALSGEQDMRKMGGLRKRIPITFWTMTMGVFAIAGHSPVGRLLLQGRDPLPGLRLSDNPLGKLLWLVGLVTAGMTSFYMFRLWFKTFFGGRSTSRNTPTFTITEPRFTLTRAAMLSWSPIPKKATRHGVHESPWIMLFPLVILAILSVIGGWVGVPAAMGGHDEIGHFLDPVFATRRRQKPLPTAGSHGLELGLAAVSVLVALHRLLHRLPLLLQEAPHRRCSRRDASRALSSRRKQVLRRRDLRRPHRHSAADVQPTLSRRPRRRRHRQRLRRSCWRTHARSAARSSAAFNPATFALMPAGWRSEPPPFCSS